MEGAYKDNGEVWGGEAGVGLPLPVLSSWIIRGMVLGTGASC